MSPIQRIGRSRARTATIAIASAILAALVVGGPIMITETASASASAMFTPGGGKGPHI